MTKNVYFIYCETLEELKAEYRKLAMQYHPDRQGGDLETMQEINNEYEQMFERLKNKHKTAEGKAYEKATNEAPSEFIDLINALLKMQGIHIEVIGSFVWVSGNTKEHKDSLKAIGFRWHTTKKVWYKAPSDYIKRSKTKYTMQEVRNMYGVQYEADGTTNNVKMIEA